MNNTNLPIGIDLGTVNSVLAVCRNSKTEIIQCEDLRITPSYVFFDPDEDNVVVGQKELTKVIKNPFNAIYDAKRLIGRSIDDENVQRIRKNYMFDIKGTTNNEIHIPIKQKGQTIYKTPQEISSEILKKFKETASKYLGQDVTEAVITVPAYFNFSQRKATKQAAELAGLKVLMLLNEPTAAFLHYINERIEDNSTSLVFDLGGGTLDISIVRFSDNNIQILSVDGDTFLGGRNFDEALLQHIRETRKLQLNKKQNNRLMSKIEDVKKKISYKQSFSTVLQYFFGDEELELHITKEEFENININLFQKCINLIDRSLKNAGLQKHDINKIIVVGGSTKIPKIQEMIREYFDGKEVLTDVNPDEAIASGAAIKAAAIKGLINECFKIIDVTPFSLGVLTYGGLMETVIKKNTPVPAKCSTNLITIDNYQTVVNFIVYEGERSRCKYNNILGNFNINNLPLKPAGQVIISVTFSINESGLLKVTAVENSSGINAELEIGVELHNLKGKYQISLTDETEEDRLFVSFVQSKKDIRKECVKFICNKTENEFDVKKCKQFIKDIDALEFEERENLKKLVESFKNDISNTELIRNITF